MHFAQWTQFDAESSLLLHSDGHLLVATARSADGKARDLGSRLFSSSTIFYRISVFLYFCISTAFLSVEGRIRVCGARHAALGEAALLNVENAALLNT